MPPLEAGVPFTSFSHTSLLCVYLPPFIMRFEMNSRIRSQYVPSVVFLLVLLVKEVRSLIYRTTKSLFKIWIYTAGECL